jgi:hypothetical protein
MTHALILKTNFDRKVHMLFWEVLYCTPILVLACVAKQKILGYQTHIIVLTVLYK